jgi:hypothetical protein
MGVEEPSRNFADARVGEVFERSAGQLMWLGIHCCAMDVEGEVVFDPASSAL